MTTVRIDATGAAADNANGKVSAGQRRLIMKPPIHTLDNSSTDSCGPLMGGHIQSSSERRNAGRRAAGLAFLIFLIYATLRYFVYDAFPADDFTGWAVRDTLMDGPRLLVFLLSLALGVRIWGWNGLGLHKGGFRTAVTILVFYFLLLCYPQFWFRETPYALGALPFGILTVSSLLVALWEEILYRGVFLNALRDWVSTKVAVLGSSILFAVMHIQAQPIVGWPSIFLTGMLFALMRVRGVALTWLIAIHWIIDSIVFLGAYGEELFPGLGRSLLAAQACFVGIYYLRVEPSFVVESREIVTDAPTAILTPGKTIGLVSALKRKLR